MTRSGAAFTVLHLGNLDPPRASAEPQVTELDEIWRGRGASRALNLQNNPTGSPGNLRTEDIFEYSLNVTVRKDLRPNSDASLREAPTAVYMTIYPDTNDLGATRRYIPQNFGASSLLSIYGAVSRIGRAVSGMLNLLGMRVLVLRLELVRSPCCPTRQ